MSLEELALAVWLGFIGCAVLWTMAALARPPVVLRVAGARPEPPPRPQPMPPQPRPDPSPKPDPPPRGACRGACVPGPVDDAGSFAELDDPSVCCELEACHRPTPWPPPARATVRLGEALEACTSDGYVVLHGKRYQRGRANHAGELVCGRGNWIHG